MAFQWTILEQCEAVLLDGLAQLKNRLLKCHLHHYSGITWASWHPKSLTTRLFVQQTINSNKNNQCPASLESLSPQWQMDSPHKGPVMQKAFPCHNPIMFSGQYLSARPSFPGLRGNEYSLTGTRKATLSPFLLPSSESPGLQASRYLWLWWGHLTTLIWRVLSLTNHSFPLYLWRLL